GDGRNRHRPWRRHCARPRRAPDGACGPDDRRDRPAEAHDSALSQASNLTLRFARTAGCRPALATGCWPVSSTVSRGRIGTIVKVELMLDFTLDQEQDMLERTIRRFAEERMRKVFRDAEEDGALPRQVVQAGWEIGLLPTGLPEAYG